MKSILYILVTLSAFSMGCAHKGVRQQTGKINKGKKEQLIVPNPDDYTGTWKVEKETYGCFPITIEKGPAKDTIKITRKSRVTSVNMVSKDSSFDSLPQNTTYDYKHKKYKLFSSALYKFIRGKIVSAHIWSPDTNDWLGVGLRTWTLDKGVLIKKKAGITMQKKSNDHDDPGEKADNVFNLDGDDALIQWEVECKYIKSA